jgi:hypothetical protein
VVSHPYEKKKVARMGHVAWWWSRLPFHRHVGRLCRWAKNKKQGPERGRFASVVSHPYEKRVVERMGHGAWWWSRLPFHQHVGRLCRWGTNKKHDRERGWFASVVSHPYEKKKVARMGHGAWWWSRRASSPRGLAVPVGD